MNIDAYIKSGIVEAYALGLLTPEENDAFELLLPAYPSLKQELRIVTSRLEILATENAVPPPVNVHDKIFDQPGGNTLMCYRDPEPPPFIGNGKKENGFIDAKISSSQISVHKLWRPAFILLFILSKIFLILFIYFMLKYYSTNSQLQNLEHKQQQPAKAKE